MIYSILVLIIIILASIIVKTKLNSSKSSNSKQNIDLRIYKDYVDLFKKASPIILFRITLSSDMQINLVNFYNKEIESNPQIHHNSSIIKNIHPDDHQLLNQFYYKAKKDGSATTSIRYNFNGEYVYMHGCIIRVEQSNGNYDYIGFMSDLLSLNNYLSNSKVTKYPFHLLFQNSGHTMVITDLSMRIIDINNQGCVFFESDKQSIIDSFLCEKIYVEDKDYCIFIAKTANNNKKELDVRFSVNNIVKYVHCIVIHDKDYDRLVFEISDITSLKVLQQNLEKALRNETSLRLISERLLIERDRLAQIGEMESLIIHQWKQPLSSINLISQLLRDEIENGYIDKDDLLKNIGKIYDQTVFMSETLDTFGNFLKTSETIENFYLSDVIKRAIFILSAQFKNSDIDVNFKSEVPKELEQTYGERNELTQIIINILSNAKDSIITRNETKPPFIKGEINITLKIIDNVVAIKICDNGCGVPKEIIDKIFKHEYTTKGDHGTGLGLALAKKVVDKYIDGCITVENIDIGACFTIMLGKTPTYRSIIE